MGTGELLRNLTKCGGGGGGGGGGGEGTGHWTSIPPTGSSNNPS